MSFQDDVISRVKEIIKDTLPEASDETIFLSVKAATINLPERIKSGRITPPVWVIDYRFNQDANWGLGNLAYRCELSIIEIRQAGENEHTLIQENLRLLSLAIFEGDFVEFVCDAHGAFNASPSDKSVNALIDLAQNLRGGTLSFKPGLVCGDFI